MDLFHGNGHKLCIFSFQQPANSRQARPIKSHTINYLLTQLADKLYWGISMAPGCFCMDFAALVPYCPTSGQYFPIRPSCSVSKRLLFVLLQLSFAFSHTQYSFVCQRISKPFVFLHHQRNIIVGTLYPFSGQLLDHTTPKNTPFHVWVPCTAEQGVTTLPPGGGVTST